jgi:hypothetical protein
MYQANKSDIQKTESYFKNNETVGFINTYKHDAPHLAYFTQRPSFTMELYYCAFFEKTNVWLTPITLHNNMKTASKSLKATWEKTPLYQYLKETHQPYNSTTCLAFAKKMDIKHVILNCNFDRLNEELKNKLSVLQKFSINNEEYLLCALN